MEHRYRYKHRHSSGLVSLSRIWLGAAPGHHNLEGRPRSPQAHFCCSITGQSLEISNLSKCQSFPWFFPSAWPSALTHQQLLLDACELVAMDLLSFWVKFLAISGQVFITSSSPASGRAWESWEAEGGCDC